MSGLPPDLIDFIHANPVAHLATLDGDFVHVRPMMPFKVDRSGIYLGTIRTKDVYDQLRADPELELCFTDLARNKVLRINGEVTEIENDLLRQEMLARFPFLRDAVAEASLTVLRILCLNRGHYMWWDEHSGVKPVAWSVL